MKKYIVKFIMLAATGLAVCVNPIRAHGAAYAIGIPPHNSAKQGAELFQSLLVFMLETAAPGDEVAVCDALNQKLVTRFVIPEGSLFQANARARAQRLAFPMTALKQFLMTEHSYPAELSGVIAFPQFLDFAATQLRRPDQSLHVVILASPFYIDASGDGACNMDAAIPSDAHLTAELQFSPFGCALRKHRLSGVTVHYAYLNAHFLNDYHQERITRFWALYCQQAGGVLCTFCSDATIAFQRAKENLQQPCVTVQLDLADTKIEMRQVVRRGVPVSRTVTNLVGQVALTNMVPRVTVSAPLPVTNEPVISTAPAVATNPPAPAIAKLIEALPVMTTTNKVVIGIAWADAVDLDLWVRANPTARDLYFNNRVTCEGRFLHDWREGNLDVDYEFVELNAESALDLSNIGAWVNYYEGNASPVRGVVVVRYEGKSYYGEFTLNCPGGNKANEKANRDQSRYWAKLDLLKIVRPVGKPNGDLSQR